MQIMTGFTEMSAGRNLAGQSTLCSYLFRVEVSNDLPLQFVTKLTILPGIN